MFPSANAHAASPRSVWGAHASVLSPVEQVPKVSFVLHIAFYLLYLLVYIQCTRGGTRGANTEGLEVLLCVWTLGLTLDETLDFYTTSTSSVRHSGGAYKQHGHSSAGNNLSPGLHVGLVQCLFRGWGGIC